MTSRKTQKDGGRGKMSWNQNEEVSKKEELTRIKIELQLALLKVQNGAKHITN